jgi:hypothetical protein
LKEGRRLAFRCDFFLSIAPCFENSFLWRSAELEAESPVLVLARGGASTEG